MQTLFHLQLVWILVRGRSNPPENTARNSKHTHAGLLFSGGHQGMCNRVRDCPARGRARLVQPADAFAERQLLEVSLEE